MQGYLLDGHPVTGLVNNSRQSTVPGHVTYLKYTTGNPYFEGKSVSYAALTQLTGSFGKQQRQLGTEQAAVTTLHRFVFCF